MAHSILLTTSWVELCSVSCRIALPFEYASEDSFLQRRVLSLFELSQFGNSSRYLHKVGERLFSAVDGFCLFKRIERSYYNMVIKNISMDLPFWVIYRLK